MDWSDEDIRNNFNEIKKDSFKLSSGELEMKYANFKSSFNKLYEMAIENQDIEKLEMMLKARMAIKNKKMSKLDAEMMVGNNLGKEYIYPKVQNPSHQDYNEAVRKIRKGKAVEELKSKTKNN